MIQSPFAFYRGAVAIMAADLANTPTSGIVVQVCCNCHLMNFGGFATPERCIIFDINDFDETLPAPSEWDIKRLATSFAIAGHIIDSTKTRYAKGQLHCGQLTANICTKPTARGTSIVRYTQVNVWRRNKSSYMGNIT